MKLLRFGNLGQEKPGIIDQEGNIRDISSLISDLNAYTLSFSLIESLRSVDIQQFPLVDPNVRIGACVDRPGKVLCVGYNSHRHAVEMGAEPLPNTEMLIFIKASSAICGPADPILYTPYISKLDWEAELAIIIGKKGKYIPIEEAKNYILGYTCCNDLSDRHLQFEMADKQFTKGKGFDNAGPLGPYLVTPDEIDPQNLKIKLWVNGDLRQDFNSSDYIYNGEQIISYLSQYFTLYPGDIISMGSAPGSAKSWNNAYLKPSDEVILTIDGLGQQKQIVILETDTNH